MPKIRLASKSGTQEVSIEPAMKADGFLVGRKAKWLKENGQWVLQLLPKEDEPAQAISQSEVSPNEAPKDAQPQAPMVEAGNEQAEKKEEEGRVQT